MKITKVKYSGYYSPTEPLKEWVGIEAEVGEREDSMEALSALRSMVRGFHPNAEVEVGFTSVIPSPKSNGRPSVKLEPDASALESYRKFKKNGNTAMMETFENMYNIPENA